MIQTEWQLEPSNLPSHISSTPVPIIPLQHGRRLEKTRVVVRSNLDKSQLGNDAKGIISRWNGEGSLWRPEGSPAGERGQDPLKGRKAGLAGTHPSPLANRHVTTLGRFRPRHQELDQGQAAEPGGQSPPTKGPLDHQTRSPSPDGQGPRPRSSANKSPEPFGANQGRAGSRGPEGGQAGTELEPGPSLGIREPGRAGRPELEPPAWMLRPGGSIRVPPSSPKEIGILDPDQKPSEEEAAEAMVDCGGRWRSPITDQGFEPRSFEA
ncbi:hypothetical protein JRQ81_009942 [Phrynocephalus forsythii]|uniref:Uncharacterized protein n=1 Tax=Phrynocephalus forsythii TaxID=171643 RepID=A0A9Q1AS60_9SAUR|nr:hypothetical protein JRQ81_009942 [Phrynocephalus forsythii]